MVAQMCLYFVNFHVVLLFCAKKKNMESYVKEKARYSFPKNFKTSLLPWFWAHKYNSIIKFIVRFVYEDDVTPS